MKTFLYCVTFLGLGKPEHVGLLLKVDLLNLDRIIARALAGSCHNVEL